MKKEIETGVGGPCNVFELRKSGTKFAEISADGTLGTFDNALCREAAKEFDNAKNQREEYQCWAKLIILILDSASKEVDHIAKAYGGTQGDLIRSFSKSEEV